jgi:hypothetical protein
MAFDKGNKRVALPPASIIPFMGISVFNVPKIRKKSDGGNKNTF